MIRPICRGAGKNSTGSRQWLSRPRLRSKEKEKKKKKKSEIRLVEGGRKKESNFRKRRTPVSCRSAPHQVTDEPRWTGRALVRPRTGRSDEQTRLTASLADQAVFWMSEAWARWKKMTVGSCQTLGRTRTDVKIRSARGSKEREKDFVPLIPFIAREVPGGGEGREPEFPGSPAVASKWGRSRPDALGTRTRACR